MPAASISPRLLLVSCLMWAAAVSTAAASYHEWALEHGLDGWSALDDPVGDGAPNLLRYALGVTPENGIPMGLIEGRTIRYPKGASAASAGDVLWRIETANHPAGPWQAVEADESAAELRYTFPNSSETNFARLRISRPAHPLAIEYSERTGLSGEALGEVSHLLHDLDDMGVVPDFLLLLGERFMSRDGATVHAVIGGDGTLSGNVLEEERWMRFDGSAAWIEFDNPARGEALEDYTLFAVASADEDTGQSMIASAFGGADQRGPRLMFNASSSAGPGAGRVFGDLNNGTASGFSGWNTAARAHAGSQRMPVLMSYSAHSVTPRGAAPSIGPVPRMMASGGVLSARASSSFTGTVWNDHPTFRVGANPTGPAYTRGTISLVLVTRSHLHTEPRHQLLATSPVRAGVVVQYTHPIAAVFDGDSVTAGAGSPGSAYGRFSWPAQLMGSPDGGDAGGQWRGVVTGRNVAIGGTALNSNLLVWDQTSKYILRRPEWGSRFYFSMISHNNSTNLGHPPLSDPGVLDGLASLWRRAIQAGATPVCVGTVSGQYEDEIRITRYEEGYDAIHALAAEMGVPFVDTRQVSQLKRGQFPSGAEYFYLDAIHLTERGYRLIAQEVAAEIPVPGSTVPRSLARPTLHGVINVGELVTCDPGRWENEPETLFYQWMRDADDIPGATSATYELLPLDVGHRISCRVTARNVHGAAERTSSHTPSVASSD